MENQEIATKDDKGFSVVTSEERFSLLQNATETVKSRSVKYLTQCLNNPNYIATIEECTSLGNTFKGGDIKMIKTMLSIAILHDNGQFFKLSDKLLEKQSDKDNKELLLNKMINLVGQVSRISDYLPLMGWINRKEYKDIENSLEQSYIDNEALKTENAKMEKELIELRALKLKAKT